MFRPALRTLLLAFVPFVVAASGCNGKSANNNKGTDSGAGGMVADMAPPGPPAPSCTGKMTQASGDWMVPFGGATRSVTVYIPAKYDPSKGTPLILNFHGYASNAFEQAFLSKMNDQADVSNFVVIYPEGSANAGDPESWNAGACCGDAATGMTDDVGFTRAILDMAEDKLCVDTKREYATGMSNGGFMANRLGCEVADRFAAVAPVAGVLGIPAAQCTPSRPMPLMHFHGTADTLVPYNGDPTQNFIPVMDSFTGWATRDQCTGSPVNTYMKGDSSCSTYEHCAGGAEVTLCTVTGGGHTWPGGTDIPMYGYTTTDLNATSAMWTFFQNHTMP